jgi:hypothetical protein
MGSVTSIHARAAAAGGQPRRAHHGRRGGLTGEIEALRAEVAALRAVIQRQAEGGDGADLAVIGIAFEAGRDSARRALGQ